MKLHDHLADLADDLLAVRPADLDLLVRESRRRGQGARRRRHAFQVGTAAASIAVAGTLGYVALRPDPAPTSSFAPSASATASNASESRLVEITGRSTVAALRAAIDEVADGRFGGYTGQDLMDVPSDLESFSGTYGQLEFTPADGSGLGVVDVNVQDGALVSGAPFTCVAWMVDCDVRTLANGDRLRSYALDPVPAANGSGRRLIAERLTADGGLRISASATNGIEFPDNRWEVTRATPVLPVAQLAAIVTQPWWGLRLPAEFDQAGGELSPYEAIPNGTVLATPPS